METVFGKVKLRRGDESDLPALAPGEPYFAEDTGNLWVGTSAGNIQVGGGAGVAAALAAHLADEDEAHQATAIAVTAAGSLAAANVQAALAELDTEKATTAALVAAIATIDAAAALIVNHLIDSVGAHAATAISFAGNVTFSATTVQGAIDDIELDKSSLDHAKMLDFLDL